MRMLYIKRAFPVIFYPVVVRSTKQLFFFAENNAEEVVDFLEDET